MLASTAEWFFIRGYRDGFNGKLNFKHYSVSAVYRRAYNFGNGEWQFLVEAGRVS